MKGNIGRKSCIKTSERGDYLKKLSRKSLIILVIVIAAVAAMLIAYFVGKNYYKNRFFAGTSVNGINIGGLTVEEAKERIQENLENYSLTIEERDGKSESISGKDLGLVYQDDQKIDELIKDQDSSVWFAHLGKNEITMETEFSFEDDTLSSIVDQLECLQEENVTKMQNAYVSLENDSFVIVPEVEGNELEKDTLQAALKEAILATKSSINLEDEGLYKEPSIRSTDEELNAKLAQDNVMLGASITYDFVDQQMTAGKEEILSWLVLGEDGAYSLDYDKVYSWVADMAYETDTFGQSHPFKTSTGEEITLLPGGDYGWCIDKDSTTQLLCQYIEAGSVATIQPEYLYTGRNRSKYDIGNTYVEVCISTQTLWCYYEGELIVTAPVITGNVSTGYATPSGSVWAIDGKKDGWEFTYFPGSTAQYWMPFNDEVGLHDASWQSDENYTIQDYYYSSGSHGCVNMQLSTMEKIFEYMEIGDPVVVYYSADQVEGPQPTQTLIAG